MPNNIIQLNEEVVKSELKELTEINFPSVQTPQNMV